MSSFFKRFSNTLWFYYVGLVLVTVLGYWPISFGLFSVKNDNIQYFLPFRYNISAAIQHGELPLWSPFIYLGFPIHGDMQSGAWNPFVWIISCLSHYDLTLFHIELLFYIFLAGLAMLKLSRHFSENLNIRFCIAASYMMCGNMAGSAQFINWVASIAFVPFVLNYYYSFLRDGKYDNAIKSAISFWLLFVCGYPSDSIYTFYILLGMALFALSVNHQRLNRIGLCRWMTKHLGITVLCIGLSAPALISYLEFMPYYSRGSGVTLAQAFDNSFELKNLISFLNPWPTWAYNYRSITDLTGRNTFIGIIPLCFFFLSLFRKWEPEDKFLTVLFLVSLLFCLGEGFGVRRFAYHFIPGMGSFRHPSHFRLYVIIAMLLLSAKGLSRVSIERRRLCKIAFALGIFCLIIVVVSAFSSSNRFPIFPTFTSSNFKEWLNNVTGNQLLFAGLCFQLLFLISLGYFVKWRQFSLKNLVLIHLANLFLFQALMPASIVGKTSPSVINKIIHSQPIKPVTSSLLTSIQQNSSDALLYINEVGRLYFYNKKIGFSRPIYNPSNFSHLYSLIANDSIYTALIKHPSLYFTNSITASTNVNKQVASQSPTNYLPDTATLQIITDPSLGYNYISCKTETSNAAYLTLMQNFYRHWIATIDEKKAKILKTTNDFMAIQLPAGKHHIEWRYKASNCYFGIALSIFSLLLCQLGLSPLARRIKFFSPA